MIPNIVHFNYFGHGRPFSYLNYLAVRAAAEIQRPDAIILHGDLACSDIAGNDALQKALPLFTDHVPMQAPHASGGVPLRHFQYQGDVARLEILQEHGGIYLDLDLLMLRPIPLDVPSAGMVMCYESEARDSISNCAMLAEAGHPFLERWLRAIPGALLTHPKVWAYHAVHTPLELYREDPSGVDVLAHTAFCPLPFPQLPDPFIFGDPTDSDRRSALVLSYGVHMWESWLTKCWWLPNVDERYTRSTDSLFGELFRYLA